MEPKKHQKHSSSPLTKLLLQALPVWKFLQACLSLLPAPPHSLSHTHLSNLQLSISLPFFLLVSVSLSLPLPVSYVGA